MRSAISVRAALAAAVLALTACGGPDADPVPQPDPSPDPPASGPARINVSPASGSTATDVTITGSGFRPGRSVELGFGPPESEYEVFSRTTADSQGRIRATVDVPDWAESGRDYLFVAVPASGDEAMARFTVTAGDEATVRVEGVLTDEGVECAALRTDGGRLYTLAGDTGGYGVGDRVVVEGAVAEASYCMQGTTLTVRSIRAAP